MSAESCKGRGRSACTRKSSGQREQQIPQRAPRGAVGDDKRRAGGKAKDGERIFLTNVWPAAAYI